MVATRYHSLVVDRRSRPDLERTAWCDGDVVMGVRHRTLPVEGVQFHPESILTGLGQGAARQLPRALGVVRDARRSDLPTRSTACWRARTSGARAPPRRSRRSWPARPATPRPRRFLIALRAKGETADELAGPGRRRCAPTPSRSRPPSGPFIDTCGTGGGRSTFNISTAADLRGRRAPAWRSPSTATARRPRKSGSADVLEALGRAHRPRPRRRSRAAWRRPASASCSRRPTTRRSGTSSRCAGRSACGRSSTCSGPLTNPAGRPAPADRRGRPGLPRADGRGAGRARQRAGAGGARARRHGRAVHGGGHRRRRGGRDRRACAAPSTRSSSASRPPTTATSPAATRPTTPACCARCWRARRGPRATWWC